MEIKQRLKEKRLEAELTQKELAEILHVSRQTVSSWEVGRTYPDLDILVTLSELYETPLDDLLKEDSNMVKDITNKVQKSQRRKNTVIVLALILMVILGYGLNGMYQRHAHDQENEEGLRPNDLLNSAWYMHYSPGEIHAKSLLSFSNKDFILYNEYQPSMIRPIEDLGKKEKKMKEWEKKGFKTGIKEHKNLKVKVDRNTYIVDAQGYHQVFTRLSDTLIRDSDGIEYYQLPGGSDHEHLRFLAENILNDFW